MRFPPWLRRRVPESRRCNTAPGCRNEAVVYESPADATSRAGEVRRCLDHPPPALADAVARGDRCPICRRGYWPDFMHLDCAPQESR